MSGWDSWVGRTQESDDLVTAGLVARYRATLDSGGAAVPQGLHWCLCLPDAATGALGPDGHAPRGDFLPPLPQPRRMWAASDIGFHAPIGVGDRIRRHSTIAAIEEKDGASGPLVFVTIEHRVSANEILAVTERQTIVYRGAAGAQAMRTAAPAEDWTWRRTILPTPTLLFRYSALTFNSHRIHYDLPYACDVEGYDGLVVQGPLTASLLLDLAARESGEVARFAFRGEAPAFADRRLTLCGRRDGDGVALAAFDDAGVQVMSARATLSPD